MTALNPYPTYCDSGHEWIGDIPRHWGVLRLKHAGVSVFGGATPKSDDQASWDGDIVWVTPEDISRTTRIRTSKRTLTEVGLDSCSARLVPEGSVVLTSRAPIGNVAIADVSLATNQGCKALVSNGSRLLSVYLYRQLAVAKEELQSRGTGTTFQEVSTSDVATFETLVPPLDEQRAIADFLDVMDARISRYIAAKRRLIALLEEQKQAIINQAVTRGLDPDVPLKPSGVDWLGDIPAHWDVSPFMRNVIEKADYRGATPEKVDSGVVLVTAKNIRMGWIDYDASVEYVRSDQYQQIMRRGLPIVGDLLLTMEAPLGNVALVDRGDIALAQRVVRFRVDPSKVLSQYALFSTIAEYFQEQMRIRGTGSTAVGLKASKLPSLLLILPPLKEQHRIVISLEQTMDRLDRLTARTKVQIDQASEYRMRLISDVVTGKLDVRGVELPAVEEYVDAEIEDALDGDMPDVAGDFEEE